MWDFGRFLLAVLSYSLLSCSYVQTYEITGIRQHYISSGGGAVVYLTGSFPKFDQFDKFDDDAGGVHITLVNDVDSIECVVLEGLSNQDKIAFVAPKKKVAEAPDTYEIVLVVNEEQIDGVFYVDYVSWRTPDIDSICDSDNPNFDCGFGVVGDLIDVSGDMETDKFFYINKTDPGASGARGVETDGHKVQMIYLSGVDCLPYDPATEWMYKDGFSTNGFTCKPETTMAGSHNLTVFVTNMGNSIANRGSLHINSRREVFQYMAFPGIESASALHTNDDGGQIFTLDGTGFDATPDMTKVYIGGVECDLISIENNRIVALTPPLSGVGIGRGELGLTYETFSSVLTIDDASVWSAATADNKTVITRFNFETELSGDGSIRVSGLFTVHNDGAYRLDVETGGDVAVFLSDSTSITTEENIHEQEVTLVGGKDYYLEIRSSGTDLSEFEMTLHDFNCPLLKNQAGAAKTQETIVRLFTGPEEEKWKFTITGDLPQAYALDMFGAQTDAIDLSYSDKVAEALQSLFEPQCEIEAESPYDYYNFVSYEDNDDKMPGAHGMRESYKGSFCGRFSLRENYDYPLLHNVGRSSAKKIDLSTYPYFCTAVRSSVLPSEMVTAAAIVEWKDTRYRYRRDHIEFDFEWVITNEWSFQCIDVDTAIKTTAWIGKDVLSGSSITLETLWGPFRESNAEFTYYDASVWAKSPIEVVQTRPSVIPGVLLNSVKHQVIDDSSFYITFDTSNGGNGIPLPGVSGSGQGETSPGEIGETVSFTLGSATLTIERINKATGPASGSLDLKFEMPSEVIEIEDWAIDITEYEAAEKLNSAFGTEGITVRRYGDRTHFDWYIYYNSIGGSIPAPILDDTNVSFEAGYYRTDAYIHRRGGAEMSPPSPDFFNTLADKAVYVTVGGVSSVNLSPDPLLANYIGTASATLDSVAENQDPDTGDYTLTFSTSNMALTTAGYMCKVGKKYFDATSATGEVTCNAGFLPAGNYPVDLFSVQDGGKLLNPTSVMFSITTSITNFVPSIGGTGGGYPVIINGMGYPKDLAGWEAADGMVTFGDVTAEIIDADPTSVTVIAPTGSGGDPSVSISLNGFVTSVSSGFTYDINLSPLITNDSPTTIYNVLGGEEYSIIGTLFGSYKGTGYVKIGEEFANIVSWDDASIVVELPPNAPGEYDIIVSTNDKGIAGYSVTKPTIIYVLEVTGSSDLIGSVYGGVEAKFSGRGFGSDCDDLSATFGTAYACDITSCSDMEFSCRIEKVSHTHVVEVEQGKELKLSKKNIVLDAGDTLKIVWYKKTDFSQLLLQFFQTTSPADREPMVNGFSSGPAMKEGQFIYTFPQKGKFYLSTNEFFPNKFIKAQVIVKDPAEQNHPLEFTRGGIAATQTKTTTETLPTSDCAMAGSYNDSCLSPVSTASQFEYIASDCHSPMITSIQAAETQSIESLPNTQIKTPAYITLEGEILSSLACQQFIELGDAMCEIDEASITDSAVSCWLRNQPGLVSLKPMRFNHGVINRGFSKSRDSSIDAFIVVPKITSISPSSGGTEGGQVVEILGEGLLSMDELASVSFGSGSCSVQSVDYDRITCVTSQQAPGDYPVTVKVSGFNIDALVETGNTIQFTVSTANTAVVSNAEISGSEITITGSNFGTDLNSVTVQLVSTISTKIDTEKEDLIEEKPKKKLRSNVEKLARMQLKRNVFRNLAKDDLTLLRKSRRHFPKVDEDRFDELSKKFWKKFTNTDVKTFSESLEKGLWRRGGSRKTIEKKSTSTETLIENPETKQYSFPCIVTMVTTNQIMCTSTSSSGSFYVKVNIAESGDATIEGSNIITSSPSITILLPAESSTEGGRKISVMGSGFNYNDTTVTVGGLPVPITDGGSTVITFTTLPNTGSQPVVITSGGISVTSPTNIEFSSSSTPTITSISQEVISGAGVQITITGTKFMTNSGTSTVFIVPGFESCTPIVDPTDTTITCTFPDVEKGDYLLGVLNDQAGYSGPASISVGAEITDISPSTSGFGGQEITVTGYGFSSLDEVSVCNMPCSIISYSPISITCITPPSTATTATETCDVTILPSTRIGESRLIMASAFVYDQSLNSLVTSISPTRGGTAGGTAIVISGSNFAGLGNTVTIDGSECIVAAETTTEITCVTEAHSGTGKFSIEVKVPGNGFAITDPLAEFFYVDRWSSIYTWGGHLPPGKGEFVVIEQGQAVMIDQSIDVLKMLLIKGGHVFFDPDLTSSDKLSLRSEYVLIVEDGQFTAGSEEERYQGQLEIEMVGHALSTELPVFGAKSFAVRKGFVGLFGNYVDVPWTKLSATAATGDTSVSLQHPVDWKAGDEIIIASTEFRFSKGENEKMTIASVSTDKRTITLTQPLKYEHVFIKDTYDGREVEMAGEVGLLTRNIIFRGNVDQSHVKMYEPCGKDWTPDQFDSQPCFNGKFGETKGSAQFGAVMVIHPKNPGSNEVTVQLDGVEVTEAGQAFRLGRYPIHFHIVGDTSSSFIRRSAIWRVFNRATTIHATNNLTIEFNVFYNVMGQTIFTEDGNEVDNVIQYNLAVFTQSSTSLLNADITPASYWLVNPTNIVRHNAAAGSTHFGYWYRIERHPSGPSTTTSYCQNNKLLSEFYNNTAHSTGRYGLWVFSMDGWFPKSGHCGGKEVEAVFTTFTAWRCDRGAEVVSGGGIIFEDFVIMDTEGAGIEDVEMKNAGGAISPGVRDSLIGFSGYLKDKTGAPRNCMGYGIIVPKKYLFRIERVTFINFGPTCAAISGCSQCQLYQGGYTVLLQANKYINVEFKIAFHWKYETIYIDYDGHLTGDAGGIVLASQDNLPPNCELDVHEFTYYAPGFEPGAVSRNVQTGGQHVPGAKCPSGTKMARAAIYNPSPSSLVGRDLIFTNQYGSDAGLYMKKRVNKKEGWMITLPANEKTVFLFNETEQLTNISYTADFYFGSPNDNTYLLITHDLMQSIDSISTMRNPVNSLDADPNPAVDNHGDYYFHNDSAGYQVTYLAKNNDPITDSSWDRLWGKEVNIDLDIYRCQFLDCIAPTAPPAITGRPSVTHLWSEIDTWQHVPVGTGGHPTSSSWGLPLKGDEIIIPDDLWIIVDVATPALGKVWIHGGLEFMDGIDHDFEASHIFIQGGYLVAGWGEDAPFNSDLSINLRGSHEIGNSDNKDIVLPNGTPSAGWKTLGVFGTLSLHGKDVGTTWSKLAATADIGDTQLSLSSPVSKLWSNKRIVITSTSKEAQESEVATVTSVSDDGLLLTIDQPLQYEHISVSGTYGSESYTLAGEVGLLERNIEIVGKKYPKQDEDSFGGRIMVASFMSNEGVEYTGSAKLSNVGLRRMGQDGWPDSYDPRYSLIFWNIGDGMGDSYVKKCGFEKNYNTAIGAFGSSNITFEDNVVYFAVGAAIRDESELNVWSRNLVSMPLAPPTYNGRLEDQNQNWHGAFDLTKAHPKLVEDNCVGGAEMIAYKTYGEDCSDESVYINNEAHSTMYGVFAWHKSVKYNKPNTCMRLNGYFLWRVWDAGVYTQIFSSLEVSNLLCVDCRVGAGNIIKGPGAVSHKFEDKTVKIYDSDFIGASSVMTQDYYDSKPKVYNWAEQVKTKTGHGIAYIGILLPLFQSGGNMAPKSSFLGATSYPAIRGLSSIENVGFYNYQDEAWGSNRAISSNIQSEDLTHPTTVENLTFENTPDENRIKLNNPSVGKVNPSDCVDMFCDGHKTILIDDTDGSITGDAGSSITSINEVGYGKPASGISDDRIPLPLKSNLDGTFIPEAEKYSQKGILRDGSCTKDTTWNAWRCSSMKYKMVVIESMDSDTEIRRLSPVGIISNDHVMLINGPQDVGWCFGYTCQERLSTFFSLLSVGDTHEIGFTGTEPQQLRFHTINADDDEKILLRVFYMKPQRYDIYVDDVFVPPTNLDTSKTQYQLLPEDPSFIPDITDPIGTNYFDRTNKFVYVVVGGSSIVDIKTTPAIVLALGIVVDSENFFEENVVANVAGLLGVDVSNIRTVNVIREDSRSINRFNRTHSRVQFSETVNFEFEVASAPSSSLDDPSTTAVDGDALSFEDLEAAQANLINCFQSACDDAGESFVSLSITPAISPPKEPGPKATEELGSVINEGAELFSDLMQQEEADKLAEELSDHAFKQPDHSKIQDNDVTGKVKAFTQFMNSRLEVFDADDAVVEDLGHESDPWKYTAFLTSCVDKPKKIGVAPFVDGELSFSDFVIPVIGEQCSIEYRVTYPTQMAQLTTSLMATFTTVAPSLNIQAKVIPIMRQNKYFSINLGLADKDDAVMVPRKALADFTFTGKVGIGSKLIRGNLKGKKDIEAPGYKMNFEGFQFTKPGAMYRINVAGVVPGVTPSDGIIGRSNPIIVFSEDIEKPTNPISMKFGMSLRKGRQEIVTGKTMELAYKVGHYLTRHVSKAIFAKFNVEVGQTRRPFFTAEVFGDKDQIAEAFRRLCLQSKAKLAKVRFQKQTYRLHLLLINNKKAKCNELISAVENAMPSGRSLPIDNEEIEIPLNDNEDAFEDDDNFEVDDLIDEEATFEDRSEKNDTLDDEVDDVEAAELAEIMQNMRNDFKFNLDEMF